MLGRIYVEDLNDYDYPIVFGSAGSDTEPVTKFWDQDFWWGDQKQTPKCVGFSWRHWLMDGPVVQRKDATWAVKIYSEAQKIDGIPGKHDGTTVRAGAKVLRKLGYMSHYRWAWNIDAVIQTLSFTSPVVVGTSWYTNMYTPDNEGIIRNTGRYDGGHAYLLNGIDMEKGLFRIKNSWGKSWGKNGNAFIQIEDFETLMSEQGEVCLPVEVVKK